MRFRLLFLSLALFTVERSVLPHSAFAWGGGHDDVMRAILKRLPVDLRATFTPQIEDAAVLRSSHYPDSFDPFLTEEIGEVAVERLNAKGIKVRYGLHSEKGIVASFIEIMEALKEENPAHLAHWIASYSHSVADMAACNHDPLVHTATYGWADWDLKLPKGSGTFSEVAALLDLSWSARNTAGGDQVFDQTVDRFLLPDDGRDATAALTEMMLYGQEGAAFCNSRGVPILKGAAAWVETKDDAGRTELWKQIGELGAWAVARTLRDLAVAQRFVKAGIAPAITPEIQSAYEAGVAKIISERQLNEEALFEPVYRPLDQAENGAIGVVCEPTWAMNGAMLGFSSRVTSVAILRSLEQRGRSVVSLDLRDMLSQGFPVGDQIPLVIVVASQFANYHTLNTKDFDRHLADYLKSGGRVLWVGGAARPPATALASLSESLIKRSPTVKLPVGDADFLSSSLKLLSQNDRSQKGTSWRIAHPAMTAAGWQRPLCAYEFNVKPDSPVEPLMILRTGEKERVVGAILRDGSAACVPIYALTPYLLEGTDHIASASEPSLDEACEEILDSLITRLSVDRRGR